MRSGPAAITGGTSGSSGGLIGASIWGANGTAYTLNQTAQADFPASNGTPPDAPLSLTFIPGTTLVKVELIVQDVLIATADATGMPLFVVMQGGTVILEMPLQGFKSGFRCSETKSRLVPVSSTTSLTWKVQYTIPSGTATFSVPTTNDIAKRPSGLYVYKAA